MEDGMRKMLRFAIPLLALIGALWIFTASAQGATWQRGYPELRGDGCDWVVAQWSDGTWTSVPWNCPAGTTPVRQGTNVGWARSYPQLEAGNCVWYVVQWNDGVYTKVPFQCPTGVTQFKDGTTTGTPQPTPVPAPAQPAATPTPAASALQYPISRVVGVNSNCGVTDFRGRLLNAQGNGVSGVAVRLRTTDGNFEVLSNLSDGDGNWDLVVFPGAQAGQWQLWVDVNGTRQSDIVNAVTNGPDRCEPGSGGVQSVRIEFQQR
jgi:hypothetical protein